MDVRSRWRVGAALGAVCLVAALAGCERGEPQAVPEGASATPTSAPTPLDAVGRERRYRFQLKLDPPEPAVGAMFKVETRVTDAATGQPVSGAQVKVDATMPEHGHGMTTEPRTQEVDAGRYVSEGMKLHMPGRWVFSADAASPDGAADQATFEWRQAPRAATPASP